MSIIFAIPWRARRRGDFGAAPVIVESLLASMFGNPLNARRSGDFGDFFLIKWSGFTLRSGVSAPLGFVSTISRSPISRNSSPVGELGGDAILGTLVISQQGPGILSPILMRAPNEANDEVVLSPSPLLLLLSSE